MRPLHTDERSGQRQERLIRAAVIFLMVFFTLALELLLVAVSKAQ